jgi:hypothetical protein
MAQSTENSIVKFLGGLDIVGADHHMTEYRYSSVLTNHKGLR